MYSILNMALYFLKLALNTVLLYISDKKDDDEKEAKEEKKKEKEDKKESKGNSNTGSNGNGSSSVGGSKPASFPPSAPPTTDALRLKCREMIAKGLKISGYCFIQPQFIDYV